MNHLVDKLIEKHLSKIIYGITQEVCSKDFEEVFSYAKSNTPSNDTTLSETFSELEKRSNHEVEVRFNDFMNEITDQIQTMRKLNVNNPFCEFPYKLWEFFLENYDIKGFVEAEIGYLFHEKLEALQKLGIVDHHGDAI